MIGRPRQELSTEITFASGEGSEPADSEETSYRVSLGYTSRYWAYQKTRIN